MEEEIKEYYESVKNYITEEKFIERLNYYREKNKDISFVDDIDCAKQVVEECIPNEDKKVDVETSEDYTRTKIGDLVESNKRDESTSISGRVMSIGNPKIFKTKQGKEGKLANVIIEDDTGSIKATFWTENIKLLKNFKEGDIIQINNVSIRKGYYGDLEASLRQRSTVFHLDEDKFPEFPKYEEEITKIADIKPEETVNIIARIVRIPSVRTFDKEDRTGKVVSLELKDDSGEIDYTLWNNSVDLIKTLDLNDGDSIKVLGALAREGRDGKVSLTHRDGRIIKGDFDVPEISNEIMKIIEVKEQDNVNICGIVSKIQDIKKFKRNDGSESKLKSFDLKDETGSIKITLWGDDADLQLNKGDIVKIIGGTARFDEYTDSGYSLNTNWGTQITINPTNLSEEEILIFDELRETLGPISIEAIQEFEEEGEEVDIIGRIVSTSDINEFQRDDGNVGIVRSADFSDGTGLVKLSLWGDKAEYKFEIGDPYQIENCRTKLGMYAVDLNVGASSRIIKLTEEQAYMLPSFETIEEMIYTSKTIDEIDEDDQNIRVVARIIESGEPREFIKSDGGTGLVRNVELADMTGSIKVVLWNEDADMVLEDGEAIKIENPNIRYNDTTNMIELSVGRNTSILPPSENDIQTLPSYEELQDLIYQTKTIGTLEEDDINVRVSGQISEPSNNRILLTKCPHCNNSIDEFGEDEYTCDYCGEEIDEPKYTLMIPARLEDEDGESISITFFNTLAEELLDMKKSEIIDLIRETDDFGVLEGKIDDLEGLNIEVIADVNFNEYDEEMRLNPKKILSKSY